MRKLDLILENIRDEYMINILEEGTTSELENLKTKKFLNENLSRIRSVLVEEGVMQGVKDHLSNNWGKYLAGAGLAGTADAIANYGDVGNIVDQGQQYMDNYKGDYPIATGAGAIAGGIGHALSNTYDGVTGAVGDAYNNLDVKAGGYLPGGQNIGVVDTNGMQVPPEFVPPEDETQFKMPEQSVPGTPIADKLRAQNASQLS